MRLVLISDTHGQHRKFDIPEGDVLIHAGDFMWSGRNYEEIIDFDVWLGSLPHKHKIVIAGNHDILFEQQYSARNHLTNATYLQDSGIEIDGLKFWGAPWLPASEPQDRRGRPDDAARLRHPLPVPAPPHRCPQVHVREEPPLWGRCPPSAGAHEQP